MAIKKHILGIFIGILITISFITPVYSYVQATGICSLNVGDFERVVRGVLNRCFIGNNGSDFWC